MPGVHISQAKRWSRTLALGSTALSLVLLCSGLTALAQPAPGSVPGSNVTASASGVRYFGDGSSATLDVTTFNPMVVQWGEHLSNRVDTSGLTNPLQNPGFSVGANASLTIDGFNSVLVNDATGGASQIFGTVNASGLNGALFIANQNGITVGDGAVLTAPARGVGLLGYVPSDLNSFDGSVSVTASGNSGAVTVQSGAMINGTDVLIAGNGAVNVGRGASSGGQTYVVAGYGFNTTPSSVVPNDNSSVLGPNAAFSVSGGSAGKPLVLSRLYAAGSVSVGAGAVVDLSQIFTPQQGVISGGFQNSGTTIVPATAEIIGGDVTNSGTVDVVGDAFAVTVGSASKPANFKNTGTIEFFTDHTLAAGGPGVLGVVAGNIFLGGTIKVNGEPLSSSNPLGPAFQGVASLGLDAGYGALSSGVVDVATNIFADGAAIAGQAVRVLSGGITEVSGNGLASAVGTGSPSDPFFGNRTLNYNFSLFPGTVYASTSGTVILGSVANANSAGTNINLDGLAQGNAIGVVGNNINGHGGLEVAGGGILALQFSGNVNNPTGAKDAGSSDFRYDFLPVKVDGSGPVQLELSGPTPAGSTTPSGTTPQFVNLLVEGDVALAPTGAATSQSLTPPLQPPATPVAPMSPYANNHLVLQATGNITLASSFTVPGIGSEPAPIGADGKPTFTWPGQLHLSNAESAANPTAIGSGSITLGSADTPVSLENLLPADLTTPDVIGQVGQSGVFLMTNTLEMNGASITTSNNSWVNFINAATANSFRTNQGTAFNGGVITGSGDIATQTLPAADFQPTN